MGMGKIPRIVKSWKSLKEEEGQFQPREDCIRRLKKVGTLVGQRKGGLRRRVRN